MPLARLASFFCSLLAMSVNQLCSFSLAILPVVGSNQPPFELFRQTL